ncbi:MAG: hypothetical protein C5B48_14215, partial [Candidatus Rokuibacteriota bacterium]
VRRSALALVRPGTRWSLWHFWDGDDFVYWYVNFERDVRRSPLGFDTVDEKLDLILHPDGPRDLEGRGRARGGGGAGPRRCDGRPDRGRAPSGRATVADGLGGLAPQLRVGDPDLPPGWDVVS